MQVTRRTAALGAAAAPLLTSLASLPVPASAKDAATELYIDQARREVTALMKAQFIPGAAAALIVDNEPVWMEAFGETGGLPSRPVDAETIFSLQSTSKTFCATAVMLTVQRGLVNLDAPLTDYLPQFIVNSRHEADPARRMTLRHLLSHRAGFTHEAPVGNNFAYDFDGPPPDFLAHVDSIQQTWLRYPVGARYAYSNLGIDVAGRVLEEVTGLPYPELLRRWIFEPLGMRRSTAAGQVYAKDPNRAVGHSFPFDRIPVRIPIVPSGGVYASLADMIRYTQFRLTRGRGPRGPVLDPKLWEEMHDFRYGADYALGIGLHDMRLRDRDVPVYTHDGGGFGFGCCFFYCPAEGVAFIVLYNRGVGGNLFDAIMPAPILQARRGPPLAPRPNPNPPVALAPTALAERAGLYMNQDSRCHAAVRDGALWLAFDNGWGDNRLTFVGLEEAWVSEGPRFGETMRFHAAKGLMAPWFEAPGGVGWDYIDGPSVTSGPVGIEVDASLGTYQYEIWGKRVGKATLSRRNGWLYFDDIRAAPYVPGLFFSGQGEATDLRGPVPTARNIQLFRA
jgi:CubicO group peptidase (beta-lactamase class C family)